MQTIIVVEDEEYLRNMYKLKLEIGGYKVIEAEDGETALKLIKSEKPSLVLLDMLIPEKDGFEVLKELKNSKDENIKSIPVVVVSNLADGKDVEEAMKIGALDYIIKSKISPSEVLEKVNKVLVKDRK